MKINEIITEKERVDELAWFIPPAIAAARLATPHVVKNLPKLVKYGKKAWDYGKKFFNPDVAKKTKGALHGLGSKGHLAMDVGRKAGEIGKKVGPKVHAAGEVGKKIVKKTPPDSSVPDAMTSNTMVPGPQAYHKKAGAVAGVGATPKPKLQGKMSPAARAAIAQAQQAQQKRVR